MIELQSFSLANLHFFTMVCGVWSLPAFLTLPLYLPLEPLLFCERTKLNFASGPLYSSRLLYKPFVPYPVLGMAGSFSSLRSPFIFPPVQCLAACTPEPDSLDFSAGFTTCWVVPLGWLLNFTVPVSPSVKWDTSCI